MTPSITLGRLFGVDIGLHDSWFIIALLITWSLVGHFGATDPNWRRAVVWTAAVVTAVLFFVSIVLHELSHALVARARGVSVRSITLFARGGVATMENPTPDARTEFWVAAAGPIASVAIGLGCYALAASLGWSPRAEVSPSTAVLRTPPFRSRFPAPPLRPRRRRHPVPWCGLRHFRTRPDRGLRLR
jgi:Zn-dependent protease